MATVRITRQVTDFINDDGYTDIVADTDDKTITIGVNNGPFAMNPDDTDQFADTLKAVAQWVREQLALED